MHCSACAWQHDKGRWGEQEWMLIGLTPASWASALSATGWCLHVDRLCSPCFFSFVFYKTIECVIQDYSLHSKHLLTKCKPLSMVLVSSVHHCCWQCAHLIYFWPQHYNQYILMNGLTTTTGAIDSQVCWERVYWLFSPCSTSHHDTIILCSR